MRLRCATVDEEMKMASEQIVSDPVSPKETSSSAEKVQEANSQRTSPSPIESPEAQEVPNEEKSEERKESRETVAIQSPEEPRIVIRDGAESHRRKTPATICVFGVASGIVVATVITSIVWLCLSVVTRHVTTTKEPEGLVCRTDDCRFISEWFGVIVNRSVDPCNNFYDFVCGSFRGPDHIFTKIETDAFSIIQGGLAAAAIPRTGQTAWQKAAGLFQACTSLYDQQRDEIPDLKNWLQSLELDLATMAEGDGFDAADTLVRASLEYNTPLVYQFRPSAVDFLGRNRAISFQIYYEDKSWYFSSEAFELNDYADYLRVYGLDDGTSKRVSENLRAYEEQVRQVFISEENRTAQGPMKIANFAQHMKALTSSEKLIEAFEKHTDNIYGAKVLIWVKLQALYTLAALADVDSIGPHGLRYVMAWRLFRRLASYAKGKDAPCEGSCAKTCGSWIIPLMEVAIMHHYDEIVASGNTMANVHSIISRVRTAYEAAMRATKWLTGNTLQIALLKLRNMEVRVGSSTGSPNASSVEAMYAEVNDTEGRFFASWLQVRRAQIRRLVRDQESIVTPVAEVNAYYMRYQNVVVIPSATLQPTLYFPQGPASVNYGSLGATIGHEITHAFDVDGFGVDDEGRVDAWGPNATDEVFLEKTLCVRKQHSQVDPQRRQAVVTDFLDAENMADLVGLIVASEAFNALPPAERNVGVVNDEAKLSPEQAFFVSFCASNCDIRNKSMTGRYAIGPGRCMVPLMNNARFAKAFGCAVEDRMNPSQKCFYW